MSEKHNFEWPCHVFAFSFLNFSSVTLQFNRECSFQWVKKILSLPRNDYLKSKLVITFETTEFNHSIYTRERYMYDTPIKTHLWWKIYIHVSISYRFSCNANFWFQFNDSDEEKKIHSSLPVNTKIHRLYFFMVQWLLLCQSQDDLENRKKEKQWN